MRNLLQEQLLKAGLVNKVKAAQVVREQAKARQRQGKAPAPPSTGELDVQQLQAERVERDRALAAGRNMQARASEQHAQIRQIVEAHKVKREGDIAYRFTDCEAIRSLLVNQPLRARLAAGTLVIVRHEQGYELLPRVAADKVRARDASVIVLDHSQSQAPGNSVEDDYYKQFEVPDDLIW